MKTSERLHALDAVRALALLLGVVLHAAMAYVPGIGALGWPIADPVPSEPLGVLFYAIHTFRMTLFFVVAGYFAHLLFHRQGLRGFWINRGKRVLAPLLVFWPLAMAVIVGAMLLAASKTGTPLKPPQPEPGTWLPFPLAHLWFLYVLLWLYGLVLALRALLLGLAGQGGQALRARIDGLVGKLCAMPMAPALMALPVALALLAQARWQVWLGIPTPDRSLLPNGPALLAFGLALGFGWMLRRLPQGLQMLARHAPLHGLVALLCTGLCLAMVGIDMAVPDLSGWRRIAYALAYGTAGWCGSFAIIGLAQRHLSQPRHWQRYVSDASYWIYLVHLPLVLALQALMLDWPLHGVGKFLLILGVAMVLLLLSYHGLVRSTWLGRWLNGQGLRQGQVRQAA